MPFPAFEDAPGADAGREEVGHKRADPWLAVPCPAGRDMQRVPVLAHEPAAALVALVAVVVAVDADAGSCMQVGPCFQGEAWGLADQM